MIQEKRWEKTGTFQVELLLFKTGFTYFFLLNETGRPDTIFTAHDATPVTFLQFVNSHSSGTKRALCILGSIFSCNWLIKCDERGVNGD